MKPPNLALAAAVVLTVSAPALAAGFANDGATIVDSGSTNTAGFVMKLWSDGRHDLTIVGRSRVASATPAAAPSTVPAALVARFFRDVKAARAAAEPARACMKSASFGSTLVVRWHGWHSPDLSCPTVGATRALAADVTEIVQTVQPTTTFRRTMPVLRRPIAVPSAPVSSASP